MAAVSKEEVKIVKTWNSQENWGRCESFQSQVHRQRNQRYGKKRGWGTCY